jgi:hypothetical protein
VPQAGSQTAEVARLARVGLHATDDRLDEHARREVLARAFLAFAGGLFEQALERGGLHVHAQLGPLGFVDEADQALEVHGIVEAGLCARVDVAQHAGLGAQGAQRVHILVHQVVA